MPPSEDRPRLYRCRQIQRPQKGRKASIVGLASAPTPYSAPNSAQPRQPGHSCNSKASRNKQAKHERRERCVPDPVNRPVPDVGTQRPRCRGPYGDALAEGSVRDPEDGDAGERGEQAVDAEQDPRGSVSVDAENLEDTAPSGTDRAAAPMRSGRCCRRTDC